MLDEITQLKLEVSQYGEFILGRVKFEVEVFETELVALGDKFNELLDKIKELDTRIAKLTKLINKTKLDSAKETDSTIRSEIQVIVEQLKILDDADLNTIDDLYDNLDAVKDNYEFIVDQIDKLKQAGAKVDVLEKKGIPALERGIKRFENSIESKQTNLLSGDSDEDKIDYDTLYAEVKDLIQNQSRLAIQQLRQVQVIVNIQDLALLKQNQDALKDNYQYILSQLDLLKSGGKDIVELEQSIKPLSSGITQFDRAMESNQFIKLSEKIYAEIEAVNSQIEEAQNTQKIEDLKIIEENLEVLFENSDDLADELEELEEQGLDIDPVLEHYDVLRLNLEQLQRVIQDAANRIGLRQGAI